MGFIPNTRPEYWPLLGLSWAVLVYLGPPLGLSWAVLHLSWAVLDYIGLPEASLGLTWACLGRVLGYLGPLIGHLRNILSRNPLQKCSRSVLRPSAGSKERGQNLFPSLEAPGVPEEAPGKSFENSRGPPRRPQARLTPFLQGAVTPSMKAIFFLKRFEVGHLLEKSRFEIRGRSTAPIPSF